MKKVTLRAVVVCCALLIPLIAGAQGRAVTPEDYFAFETISDPHFSPDGSVIAYVKTTIDQKQNRRQNTIWTIAANGTLPPVRLITVPQSASSPRWSPDGRAIAFVMTAPAPGDRADEIQRAQVWTVRISGGEPKRMTTLVNGVTAFQWSPDSKRLVCVSRSGPSDLQKSPSDVRHYKHLSYKFNDSGWFDDKRTHLWIVDVETGAAKQITDGQDWNDSDPQWSPDGTRIAFVSDRTGKAFDEGRNSDVWVIDANGGPLTKISSREEPDNSPRWSPDGQTIAYVGATEERAHPKVWLAPAGGGPSRLAAEGLDLIPTALQWADGGRALYFETGVKGTTHLYRIDLSSKRAAQVTSGQRTVRSVSVSDQTKRLVYLVNDPMHLDDLYVSDLSGGRETRLTHLNAALWPQLALVQVERLPFKGADGWDVDGFLMKPVGWQPGRKYPMVLSIHGGPAGMYGFDWFHEFQVYASQGWAVFFTNPRGSTGYGEKFDRGVQLEWGGKAYVDIMNGVDAVLAQNPWIDTGRLGVTGGSYGGYMTNWIISHTDRFKAAVTLRSISNFVSDDGTRDGAYGHADDFGGDIFENYDLYWNYSPLKYAKNVKTPTLILHSDNDFRVPIEQGEQWFRALQHFGVPSEIVFFPRENHNLTRTGEPKHLVESLKWQVYWFDRYLNGNESAVPPDQLSSLPTGPSAPTRRQPAPAPQPRR
jgi:dipeptidyl aminopeptidase/acylaminoacyl peptidase